MTKDALTEKIIGCCFKIHTELGPGFNEKAYQNALKIVLKDIGLKFEEEKEFNVCFQDRKIGRFRLDMIIEDKVVVEIKSITGIMPKVFEKQLLAYLKASGLHIGLLINFGNDSCQIKRLIY